MGSNEFSERVRGLVLERARGRCEWCGKYARLEIHHRLYRSRGGLGNIENAVALCGWGNHTGCHGRAHSDPLAVEMGFTVPRGTDPAGVPVALWGTRRLLANLENDGGISRATDLPCFRHLMEGAGAVRECSRCRLAGDRFGAFPGEFEGSSRD